MTKDDATWLNICYVLLALLASYVFFQAVYTLGVQAGWTERYDEWFPMFNNVTSICLGIALTYWIQKEQARKEFHLAAITELRKVTWPTIPDTKRMTIVVAIVVTICSIIMTIFDMAWSKVLQTILP